MSLTLGEKLRAAREERGISISEVAEQTRISPHYLESIENDDYKTLPGGIFNKGFVKSYGKYVGLDESEVLQDYARLSVGPDVEEHDGPLTYRPEVLTDDHSSGSLVPTIIFAVIILALMTGGILFLVSYLTNRSAPTAVVQSPAPAEPNPSAAAQAPAVQPSTDQMTIELKAVSEPVWVNYTVDGTPKIQTLAANESVRLDPKESVKVSYSKAKASNLQIVVNGKSIASPRSTAKGTIEVEINRSNLAEVLQSGEFSASTSTTTPESSRQAQAAGPAKGTKPSPKPSVTPGAKSSATPIVVGRPRTVPTP